MKKFTFHQPLLLAVIALLTVYLPQTLSSTCILTLLVIDESGSMEKEQEFLRDEAMKEVVADLVGIAGGTAVYICSWGFAYTDRGRIPLSGRYLGCSKGFDVNDYGFKTNGGTEDGYAAIDAAIAKVNTVTNIDGDNLDDCTDIYKYIIFASDEDRDNTNNALTYASTLQLLQREGWTVHAILNNPILKGDGIGAVEQSASQWKVYKADLDPKTTSGYAEITVYTDPVELGPGKPDYTGLAFGTDGAVWDLNKLRDGGFTTAFREIFTNTTTEIIIDDIESQAPSISPAPSASPKPVRSPVTAAPSPEPDICSTQVVLACVKNTSEGAFRAVLRLVLKGVLSETELDTVIPPLSDELNKVSVQKAVQAQLCLFATNPATFDVLAAATSIFSATIGSLNALQLATVAYNSIVENIDLTPERGIKLLTDLGTVFTQGIDPGALVGELFTVFVDALKTGVFECSGISLPDPPAPSASTNDCTGFFSFLCSFCFSGHVIVDVQGKGAIRMDQLKIGDSVLAADGSYSTVYSFGHYDSARATSFLQIFAEGMLHPLEITPDHLLYMKSHDTKVDVIVPAGRVKVGDLLATANSGSLSSHGVVHSIRVVQRQGMYAPFTETGNLMVNGVAASNYLALPAAFQQVVSFNLQHWVQHMAYLPYQLYCRTGAKGCVDEKYEEGTGLSKAVTFWLPVLHGVEWILVNVVLLITVIVALVSLYFLHLLQNRSKAHFYKPRCAVH